MLCLNSSKEVRAAIAGSGVAWLGLACCRTGRWLGDSIILRTTIDPATRNFDGEFPYYRGASLGCLWLGLGAYGLNRRELFGHEPVIALLPRSPSTCCYR